MRRFWLIWRLARTDLRSGLAGFRVFVVSLALGALVIAASGAAAQAFRDGLSARSREIIGGDLLVSVPQRPLAEEALAAWRAEGRTAYTIETRAMGQAREERRLLDVRGYGPGFPLEGKVETREAPALAEALAVRDGVPGALVEQGVLDAFDVAVGDRLQVGRGEVRITGVLLKEPDALGRGFALSPRIVLAAEALPALGLAGYGNLFQTQYRLVLPPEADIATVRKRLEAASDELRRRVQDRRDAAPGLSDLIDRLEAFLDFVGFAALLAGGVGVAGSIRGWLAGKRASIATMKTLGASSLEIEAGLFLQTALLAVLAAGVGAAVGALSPYAIAQFAGDALPLQPQQRFYLEPFLSGMGLSVLAALGFAAAPIGAGKATAPSSLYRGQGGGRSPWAERALGVVLILALTGAAALTSRTPLFTLAFAGAALGAFIVLFLLGWSVRWLARRLGFAARGVWRLALAGLGGPSSLAPSAAPALGLGVALLCALAQTQANLVRQVEQTAPASAPSIVFTEIPAAEAQAFDALIARVAGPLPRDAYVRAPVLTSRLIARNGSPIDPQTVKEGERWFVENDIGSSVEARLPLNESVAAGKFWGAEVPEGEVSLEVAAARGVGLEVGDLLTFEVAGVPVEARLTSLRKLDWGSFGGNFPVLFSPGLVDGAIARHAAIARMEPETEERIIKALGQPFPGVSVLRVRTALAAAAELFKSLKLAIQVVSAVAIGAGALAVAGAIAAGARRRVYEGAVLRALGAVRGQVLTAVALELALTGAAAAVIGAALGFGAAYFVIVQQFEAKWVLDAPTALGVVGGAVAALGLAGLAAGWAALSQPPARTLKDERAGAA